MILAAAHLEELEERDRITMEPMSVTMQERRA